MSDHDEPQLVILGMLKDLFTKGRDLVCSTFTYEIVNIFFLIFRLDLY